MRYLFIAGALMLGTSPAWAALPVAVPEMDAGFGFTALAIVVGAAAIVREKFFRK